MITRKPWLLKYLQVGPVFNTNLQPVLLQVSNFHRKYFVEVIFCDISGQHSLCFTDPHCEEFFPSLTGTLPFGAYDHCLPFALLLCTSEKSLA